EYSMAFSRNESRKPPRDVATRRYTLETKGKDVHTKNKIAFSHEVFTAVRKATVYWLKCERLVGHKDFPLSIVTSVYNPHFSDFSYMPKGWDYRQGSTVFSNIFLTPQPLTFGQCPFLLFLPLTKDL